MEVGVYSRVQYLKQDYSSVWYMYPDWYIIALEQAILSLTAIKRKSFSIGSFVKKVPLSRPKQ